MSDITIAWIQKILKEIGKDYPYPKIELHADLSGKVMGDGLVLFSFVHIDHFIDNYAWWKKQGEPAMTKNIRPIAIIHGDLIVEIEDEK